MSASLTVSLMNGMTAHKINGNHDGADGLDGATRHGARAPSTATRLRFARLTVVR
jgi:hypothetical protein